MGLVLKQGTLLDATLVGGPGTRLAGRWRRGAALGVPPTRTRPGRSRGGERGLTSATRCIWGWTPTRAWCGGPLLTAANVAESEVADALVSARTNGPRSTATGRMNPTAGSRGSGCETQARSTTASCTVPTSISGPSPTGSNGATALIAPRRRLGGESPSGPSSAVMAISGSATADWGAMPWSCRSSSWPTTCAKRTPWPPFLAPEGPVCPAVRRAARNRPHRAASPAPSHARGAHPICA